MWSRIGLMVVAFSLSALRAMACVCAGGGIGDCKAPVADMIVVATVISKEMVPNRPLPYARPSIPGSAARRMRSAATLPQPPPWVKVTLSVSERFRGRSDNSIVIRTDLSDCGYPFEVGHEYLVFAREFQGTLMVDICTATRPAKMTVATIRQLQALRDGTALPNIIGFVGTHPPDTSETGWEQVQPIPGLTMTARSERGEYRTETTRDGFYEFLGLPAGRYQLSPEQPVGRVVLWGGGADHLGVNVGLGDACPVNFQVYYDGRISGTVVGPDGQPMSGFIAALYAGPEKLNAAPVGSQVKNGYFEIPRLWPGRYRLLFLPRAEGRTPTPEFYYPGTRLASEAVLIEVGDGAHVDGLHFTVF